MANPKVVILCGGRGTRLRNEVDTIPKALVKIGDMPILWHIMKTYDYYGFREFVLCLGYKGEMIKNYFLTFEETSNDFTLDLRSKQQKVIHHQNATLEDWRISFINTGLETPTGGRVKKIEHLIDSDLFMLTYGDGLSDINIKELLEFHKEKKKIATLTAAHPSTSFGTVEVDSAGIAKSFKEKPMVDGLINGGFFVFDRRFFRFLEEDSVLEEEPLKELTRQKELAVYVQDGFWQCMDTFKQAESLNKMWEEGKRPWAAWEKKKYETNFLAR